MYCVADYKQSLPLSWLQAPTEKNRPALLEFSRGTLYSLSNSKKQNGGEVHISSIRHVFERLGSASLARVGLKLLKLLREAESLPGGYWIPTPFRVLDIGNCSVFVGAVPTAIDCLELNRCEGLYRILTSEAASRFPRQDLSSWMGNTFNTPASEFSIFLKRHLSTASPANNQTDIEYFNVAPIVSKRSNNTRHFLWQTRPSSVAENQIALCRQRKFGFYRYFSSDLRSDRVVSEAAIETSVPRLLFSLAHQLGSPVPFSARNGVEGVEISIAEQLPVEEYRLALLLSRRIAYQGHSRTFYVAPELAPTLIERLQNLGCVMETGK